MFFCIRVFPILNLILGWTFYLSSLTINTHWYSCTNKLSFCISKPTLMLLYKQKVLLPFALYLTASTEKKHFKTERRRRHIIMQIVTETEMNFPTLGRSRQRKRLPWNREEAFDYFSDKQRRFEKKTDLFCANSILACC